MSMNGIQNNMKSSVLKTFVIAALAVLMILAGLGLSKAHAAQMDLTVTSSDGYPCDNIHDDSYYTSDLYEPGTEVTITADGTIDSLYIQWEYIPGEWTLKVNGNSYTYGKEGYLHEYIKMPEEASSAVIVAGSTRLTIADIYAFSQGNLPAFVQTWEEPYEEADILLISTHADDEVLFFGGIIPNYIDRGNVRVQVAYFSDLFQTELYRNHEILNGLWTMGVTHYPQLGEFYDSYSESFEEASTQYDYDSSMEYIVRTIRRFHPQVVIGQDPLNGEYGHGGHMWCARIIEDALEVTADENSYPESAKKYGTWDVKKTYFHLYPENQVVMDVRKPLSHFGGKTCLEVARAAYKEHDSQQWCWFYVTDDGYDEYGEYDDKGYTARCTVYGLYRTTVGPDFSGSDILDNITTYDDQAKQANAPVVGENGGEDPENPDGAPVNPDGAVENPEGEQAAAEGETAASAQSVVNESSQNTVRGGRNTTALTVLIVIAIILFIAIVGIIVVSKRRENIRIKERELSRRARMRNVDVSGSRPAAQTKRPAASAQRTRTASAQESRPGMRSARNSAQPQTAGRSANKSQGMRSRRMANTTSASDNTRRNNK